MLLGDELGTPVGCGVIVGWELPVGACVGGSVGGGGGVGGFGGFGLGRLAGRLAGDGLVGALVGLAVGNGVGSTNNSVALALKQTESSSKQMSPPLGGLHTGSIHS